MQIFNSLSDIKINSSTVVLLGKFDGMHRGHRKLFERARQIKADEKLDVAVFTMRFKGEEQSVLCTGLEKHIYLEAEGTDYLVECDFDDIKDIDAADFILNVVLGRLKARVLVAGPDCSFGRNKKGNADIAMQLMEKEGQCVEIIEKSYADCRTVISSSFIKDCIKNMQFDRAVSMLSHPYMFAGEVIHGSNIGHTIEFPTLNIEVDARKVIPEYGVYASYVIIEEKTYVGVSNIGVKPTVGSNAPALETYVLDFDGDVYGKTIAVELFKFIRKEKKFSGLDELRQQISSDTECVRRIANGSLE
jgi:riboflavin kinase/FMN adenylyltransferase